MTSSTPALILAAAGVGFGHAILPDHWVPLAVLARTRRYPLTRVARMSGLAGVAHVLVSLILGTVIITIGLQFRSSIQTAQDTIIGCILIATGLGFALLDLTGHGHHHAHDQHDHHDRATRQHDHEIETDPSDPPSTAEHPGSARPKLRGLAAVMVPFGAAASPDLTILPVFLAATAAGTATAVGALIVFAAVTIVTIVALTLLATRGGYQIQGQWLERWGNVFTALVLVIIGLLVLTGTI